ncbi:MAG: sugar-binding protein, partial [Armatimonadota bacterium]|nr:sugar-binding protein [Armatimonadota bacterium]
GCRSGMARLRDATGQEHLASFSLAGGGWQEVRLPITPQRFSNHWSGANDGTFHFPLNRLLIAASRPGKGYFLLRDVTVVTTDESLHWRVTVTSPLPGHIAFAGEGDVPIHVRVMNATQASMPAEVRVRVVGYDGRPVMEKTWPVRFGKWHEELLEVKVPRPRPGYYAVEAWAMALGKVAARTEGGLAVVFRPRNVGRADAQAFFGLHTGNPEASERIGVKWARFFRQWRWMESPRGNFWFEDGAIDAAHRRNMGLMLCLQAEPPSWVRAMVPQGVSAWSAHPEALECYRNFIRESVRHYRSVASVFEVQNEPDLTCCRHENLSFEEGVEHYIRMVRVAVEEIRREAPGVPIAGVDVSGGDYNQDLAYSRAVLSRVGPLFDIYTGHPYASPRYFGRGMNPRFPHENRMAEKLRQSQQMLADLGLKHRVWIGEKGWGLDVREPLLGRYSKEYAACVGQALITARSVPGIERFFWFLHNGCNEKGYEYGLWRGDPEQPLPAAAAYATCARFLDHAAPRRALRLAEEVRGFAFASPERNRGVVTLWSLGEEKRLSVALPSGAEAWDLMGSPTSVPPILLTRAPLFLAVPLERLEALAVAIEKSPLMAARPVRLEAFYPTTLNTVAARLTNRLGRALSVALRVGDAEVSRTIPPGDAPVVLSLPVRGGLLARRGGELRAVVRAGKEDVATGSLRVDLLPCPRRTLPADASRERLGAPMLRVADRAFVQPPDPGVGWDGPDDLSADAWWGYDDEAFYLVVCARDDVHAAPDAGSGFWKSDSLQVAFDPHNDAADGAEYDANDVELGCVATPDGGRVLATYPRATATDATGRVRRAEKETTYWVRVPWRTLGVRPTPGTVISFNFILNDNDGAGRAYWMGPRPGIGEGKRPAEFLRVWLE